MTDRPTYKPDMKPHFGDIIENGWASEENPTRRGYFVREGRRTGRFNAGRYYEVTDGRGKFWQLSPVGDHRITIEPGPFRRTKTAAALSDLAALDGETL